MRKTLWGSVMAVCMTLALISLTRNGALAALYARAVSMAGEVQIPTWDWDRLVVEGPVPLACAGAALAMMALVVLARGAGGRRRVAERMMRSGRTPLAVARRTRLAQDAIRMLEP